jgi:Transposase DDE domain
MALMFLVLTPRCRTNTTPIADRHIPMAFKVRNWPFWAAIQTTLMVCTAFRLGLRQTEGPMALVITLMELTISAPDHSTISRPGRNAAGGPADLSAARSVAFVDRQHRPAGLRSGATAGGEIPGEVVPPEMAVDADNGMIVARTLTDQDSDDPSQVAPLLNQIDVGMVLSSIAPARSG